MATLTVRRLDDADRDWLRAAADAEGVSMEEYVRRLIRAARASMPRTAGDVLERMNAATTPEEREMLGGLPPIERPAVVARDPFVEAEPDSNRRAS